MPTLLSLPAELHLQIIKETDLYDLESLWTSCKTFFVYGEELLQMHRHRQAKYHTITVGWDNGPPKQIHPLLDLRDILEDEEGRLYHRVMEINSLSYGDPEDDRDDLHAQQKQAEIDKIIEKHGDRITTLVSEIHGKLLPNAPTTDAMAWNNEIQLGEPVATVIFLLALNPHLESLRIYDAGEDWWNSDYGALFTSLTAAAMDPTTNTLGIFSKLSEFTLKGCIEQSGMESQAELFSPFMALPKMRSVEAYDVDGRDVQWPWGPGFSQVINIKLEVCDIDTTTLNNHIGAVKALERFTYAYHENIYADNSTWEPRAILKSLQLHACDTLVFLELTADALESSKRFQNDEPFIGSLRAFKVLQEVKLDTMMLYERIELSARTPLEPAPEYPQDPWEQTRAHRLIDLLPASIRRFHMTSRNVGKGPSRADVSAMFKGLPELRKKRLPNLKEICVEYTQNGDAVEKEGRRELRSRCRKADVEVESIKWTYKSSSWTSQVWWTN